MRAIHHICIQTDVYEASKYFYEMLGFETTSETHGFHGRDVNAWLRLGDFYIELQTAKAKETLQPYTKHALGPVHFALYVDDLNAEVERLKAAGIEFLPKQGETIYFVVDGHLSKARAPEGTIVELRDSFLIR